MTIMLLFPTAAQRFVQESGSARTPASRRCFLDQLGQLQARFPGLEVHQFTTDHLTRFCLQPTRKGPPSPNTIKARKGRIRSFFEWAAWQKLVKTNPANDLKFTVRPGTGGVRQHVWLEEPEVAHLLRSCPDTLLGQRERLVCMVGLFTGLRRSELAALRWSSFTADRAALTLVGKGNKLATIGVPPQLRVELAAWRLRAQGDVLFPTFQPNGWGPEAAQWDRPIGHDAIARDVRAAGIRAGFPDLAPHDLRRTFAGMLESKGVPIQDISKALRHANVAITSVYLEKNPRRTVAVTADFTLAL